MTPKKKAPPDSLLLRSLGRSGDAEKRLFLSLAKGWLEFRPSKPTWTPSVAQRGALTNLVNKSRALAHALESVSKSGVPASAMIEAWSAVGCGEPFPRNLNSTTLLYLQQAAHIWLPETKAAHRPRRSDLSTFIVKMLAVEFRSAFAKYPAAGTDSPFVKFCQTAFPYYGLDIVAAPQIRKIIESIKPR